MERMIRDRRGDEDRRSGKNRRSDPAIEKAEVDGNGDRREDQRRRVTDRRFSATPFEGDKAKSIRDKIERTGTLGRCPLCNNRLTLGEPVVTEVGPQREVRCEACWKSVPVTLV